MLVTYAPRRRRKAAVDAAEGKHGADYAQSARKERVYENLRPLEEIAVKGASSGKT